VFFSSSHCSPRPSVTSEIIGSSPIARAHPSVPSIAAGAHVKDGMVHLTEAPGFGMDRLGGRREIPIRRVTATMGAMLSLSFGLLLVTGLLGSGLAMAHLRACTQTCADLAAQRTARLSRHYWTCRAAAVVARTPAWRSDGGRWVRSDRRGPAFDRIDRGHHHSLPASGRRRLPGLVIAIHASLAISGITVLVAYALMG
jgi:hypothetical protein